jgi:hypothetical protein
MSFFPQPELNQFKIHVSHAYAFRVAMEMEDRNVINHVSGAVVDCAFMLL